jgi:hypothetical protein
MTCLKIQSCFLLNLSVVELSGHIERCYSLKDIKVETTV